MPMRREVKDRSLFDAIAAQYTRKDVVRSAALARRGQLMAAMAPLLARGTELGTIVEVGCGVGAPAQYLHGRYQHYIGIDQSAEMIAIAQQFNREIPEATWLAENVKATSVPDNTADLILCVGALHHMTQLDHVVHSMIRMAKPGAGFVLIEPQNGNPLIQWMRRIRTKIDAGYSADQTFFSEQALRALLSRHGITELAVAYHGYLATPFAQVIINPQAISVPLSRLAIHVDRWLNRRLRGPLRKLSFNIVLTGTFPHD